MEITDQDLLLVTGATGLVGSHVAERARKNGIRTRALVRSSAELAQLHAWDVETYHGDMTDANSLRQACEGVSVIVHCAAKVGDWGPSEAYREVNVDGLQMLLSEAEATGTLKRFVQISSLGVYQARDHYGTDESEQPNADGIDGYTLTKIESEKIVRRRISKKGLPAVILRPGFIYGPRDRTVLPRLLEKLKKKKFAYLGTTDKLMNNTWVGNLVDAIFLAIERDDAVGKIFNIRDGRAVTKAEFIQVICDAAAYETPTKVVPMGVARGLAYVLEGLWKLLKMDEAPILSSARLKFLGLNLDYSIDKAKNKLGYDPQVDFTDAMTSPIDWLREQRRL